MSYQSEVLADSPLLYVRFEEPSGATCANDGSLGGNATAQGTYTRNVSGGAAGLGVAITLNGTTSDYVSYPDHASLDITGEVTYECWVKSSYTAVRQCLMTKGGDSGGAGYAFHLDTNRALVVTKAGVANLWQTTAGAVPDDGNWHHVAFTRSSNTYVVYVDGAAVSTSSAVTTVINTTSVDFNIGREVVTAGAQRPLAGSIDEVAVYGTALSAARIAAHYAARATSPPTGPVAAFSGAPTTGAAPLTVQFTDESTGTPTSWDWDFGDTNTSTDQHPEHEYTAPGSYDVELEVTNAGGSDDELKAGYITVTAPELGIEGFSVAFDDPTLEPDPTWTRLA
jgi:PKD repeat protein